MACETELPWLGDHCQRCALPLPAAGMTCGQCLMQPPAFDRVVAPWTYNFPIDSLITRFKHSAKWPYGHLLGDLLAQSLQHRFNEDLPRPRCAGTRADVYRRLRQRASTRLPCWRAGSANAFDVPIDERLLLRPQDTNAQQDLNAEARKRNLHHAFALASDASVKGRHLALVDDVLTTGATTQALALLLLDAGASRVDVYCLARTPKPGESP